MAHYRLNPQRIHTIEAAIVRHLERRVMLTKAAFSITPDELEQLAFPDEQLEAVRTTASFYPGVRRYRDVAVRALIEEGGRSFYVIAVLHLSGDGVLWPIAELPGIHVLSKPRVYSLYARSDRQDDACIPVAPAKPHTAGHMHDAKERIAAWMRDLLRAMRREELGRDVMHYVLSRSETLTNVLATLPDVKAVLNQTPEGKYMLQQMDKAPARTLSRYAVGVDKPRLHALKLLLAESLVLPASTELSWDGPIVPTAVAYAEVLQP